MVESHAGSNTLRRGTAFTLVELLVVIGIIAVLIAVLLPALNKARESARQVQCLSNMRQISTAIISWASDHNGLMPAAGGSGVTYYDPLKRSFTNVKSSGVEPADWLAWQRQIDPVLGIANTKAADQNITYSATARYLGAKLIDHNPGNNPSAYPDANRVNTTLESVFVCPSDKREMRVKSSGTNNGSIGFNRYSYAMNSLFGNPVKSAAPFYAPTGTGNWQSNDRRGFTFNGKIASIRRPSECVLLICEDEQTIEDAYYNVQPSQWQSGQCEMVAGRHSSSKRIDAKSAAYLAKKNLDTRGNVSFCDGHGEFLSRKDALRGKYSGRPDPDDPAIDN